MNDQQKEMPRYKSHKTVWALKISGLRHTGAPDQESDGSLWMDPVESGYAPIKLDAAYVRKHSPVVGGYFVTYPDGYKSFSPEKAFNEGYTAETHNKGP
jgi:hypothetical protein